MKLTLDQKLDNILSMFHLNTGDFEKSENLSKDLRKLHHIVTTSTKMATKPGIQNILFETYKLCVEFKLESGVSAAECVWAMTNTIKDIHSEIEHVTLCLSHSEDHDATARPFIILKQKEIEAILDVIVVTTMNDKG